MMPSKREHLILLYIVHHCPSFLLILLLFFAMLLIHNLIAVFMIDMLCYYCYIFCPPFEMENSIIMVEEEYAVVIAL